MRVLVYGSGAREHALAWKISQSPLLEKLYLAGANDGFSYLGEVLEAQSFGQLVQLAKAEKIDLLLVGPELPLTQGIVEAFEAVGIDVIGSGKYWTQLESSKSFAKNFMQKHNILTAKYEVLTELKDVQIPCPIAIKADGLCGGKGVCVAQNKQEAKEVINEYLSGKFAEASKKVVVEEFLQGKELSLMTLWDGETLLPFIPARDFKKLEDDDKGPNTGGMAAYCPVGLSVEQQKKLDELVVCMQTALRKEKADFKGVIYFGLIWNEEQFKVLEFNMRFGDPEAQVLMMHLESDLLGVLKACAEGKLSDVNLKWRDGYSACLTIASKGYPSDYPKEIPLKNIPDNVQVFYAGVKKKPELVSNGGRVLSLCKSGKNPYNEIYKAAQELDFSEKYFRTDIKID